MEFTFCVVAPYPPWHLAIAGFDQVDFRCVLRWRRCGTLETARAGARRTCHAGVRANASTRRSEGTRRRGPRAGRDTPREAGCKGVKRPAMVTHRRTCCASFRLTLLSWRRSGRFPAVAATIPWIFLGLWWLSREAERRSRGGEVRGMDSVLGARWPVGIAYEAPDGGGCGWDEDEK